MKIGAFTTFAMEYTFPEACRMIKAIGYTGVQPRIVPAASAKFDATKPFNPWGNNKGGILEDDFFKDPKAVLKPATDLGLEISSVASYTSTADMDRAVNMVRACGKIGIQNVRVAGLPMPRETKYDANAFIDKSRGAYKELVAEAKKAGVRPCLELHMGTIYPSASGATAFLKPFSPAEVGILLDPANMASDGWETPVVALNVMGPYLAEVHVKNVRPVMGEVNAQGIREWKFENCDLEDGIVNWAQWIDLLKQHGYTGWLVEEGHTHTRDSYTRLKTAYDLLVKLLADK